MHVDPRDNITSMIDGVSGRRQWLCGGCSHTCDNHEQSLNTGVVSALGAASGERGLWAGMVRYVGGYKFNTGAGERFAGWMLSAEHLVASLSISCSPIG